MQEVKFTVVIDLTPLHYPSTFHNNMHREHVISRCYEAMDEALIELTDELGIAVKVMYTPPEVS